MTNKQNDRDAAIALAVQNGPTWAALARALETPDKPLRTNIVRGVFGLYVQRGDVITPRERAFVAAYHLAPRGDARKAIHTAFVAGDALPPTTA